MKTIETISNEPFRHLISTIGELPTSFTESMSYYEMLAWLCDFIEKKVVPVVDENAEALIELQDYVVHYFDNLDVQEEINNKLDDMAESGQLAEIIATYLEVKAILAFDTPVELKSADNLIAGSFAKTYGYKRKGDGVYDLYFVRNVQIGDVDDGYNIISLTENPQLVAIRIQQGSKRLIEWDTSDNIQNYLDLDCDKEIVFPKGQTVTFTDALLLNSDTCINLNGATVIFDFDRSEIFDYDWDETLGFMSYRPTDTFTGYDGYKNITIKNGSIHGGCSCFLHSQNVTFDNVSFETSGARHSMQLAACKNFTVRNCEFNGTRDEDVQNASECINIDKCVHGAQPYLPELSPIWDETKCKNIYVENNTFIQPSTGSLVYKSAVGTHGSDRGTAFIAEGVVIRDNNFTKPKENAISIKNYYDVVISNNLFYNPDYSSFLSDFIYKVGSLESAQITENNVKHARWFFRIGSPALASSALIISDNQIRCLDPNDDTGAVFMLFNVHNSSIINNTIQYQRHVMHINTRAYWDQIEDVSSDHSYNIWFANNSIEKLTNQDSYFNARISDCDDIRIINNSFIHDGTLENTWVEFLFQNTQTKLQVKNNHTDQPELFVPAGKVTSGFSNNNALYKQSSIMSSTSTTGTLNGDITNFSKLILSVGETVNTQNLTMLPYLPKGNKFDKTDQRTLKYAIVKNNDTVGYAKFTYNTDGTSWSYTGDIPLRYIWAQD